MGQLVELVFEGVSQRQVLELCTALKDRESASRLLTAAQQNSLGEICLPKLFLSSSLVLLNAHLRVFAYEEGPFDVEVNFDLNEQTAPGRAELQEGLRDYSSRLAARLGVSKFFAGLEPASDEVTRIFTGEVAGPYSL